MGQIECSTDILITAKVEIFRGLFGEFRPNKPGKMLNNLKNAIKIYFRPMSTNPLAKITTLITLLLLHSLRLYFKFRKIQFINDGSITQKRILALKNLEKCFGQ